ncbi:MAG: Spy/CpxP family protein refolding chaperone [Candidatus Marinimicrobia bacterium]|nr:Spy/CpxP family protein refolding chaperone [Candidatus Neomarinimicrobiota bacterium]
MKRLIVFSTITLLLASTIFGQQMQRRMIHKKMIIAPEMTEKLQLTDDQIAKLKEIQRKYKKESIKLMADLKIARLELSELVDKEASEKEIQKAIDNVNTIRGKLLKLKIQKKLDIAKVLTDEQKKLLKKSMPFRHLLRGYCPMSGKVKINVDTDEIIPCYDMVWFDENMSNKEIEDIKVIELDE